jgi:hypothetical protein
MRAYAVAGIPVIFLLSGEELLWTQKKEDTNESLSRCRFS